MYMKTEGTHFERVTSPARMQVKQEEYLMAHGVLIHAKSYQEFAKIVRSINTTQRHQSEWQNSSRPYTVNVFI